MTNTDLTVKISKTINAPIEKVFNAWLKAETLSQFILPAVGMPQPDVETDAVKGGRFTIVMHVGDDKVPHTGEYLEIDSPNKLVFTWESPCSADNSTVTINFKSVNAETTGIELIHVRFIDEGTRSDHEGGWGNIIDKLADIL